MTPSINKILKQIVQIVQQDTKGIIGPETNEEIAQRMLRHILRDKKIEKEVISKLRKVRAKLCKDYNIADKNLAIEILKAKPHSELTDEELKITRPEPNSYWKEGVMCCNNCNSSNIYDESPQWYCLTCGHKI